MYKRITKTVLALFLGTGQEMLFQVLSAIIWISAWGVELYSEWLLLSLLPLLLMRGNTGLFHSATSRLIGNFSSEDYMAARYSLDLLIQGQRWFLLLIAVIYVAAAAIFVASLDLNALSHLSVCFLTVLFIVQFAVFQRHQTLLSLVKASGRAPEAVMWQNAFRTSFIVPMLAVPFLAEPLICFLVSIIAQMVVVMLAEKKLGAVRRKLPPSACRPDRREVITLFRQGMGFSSFGFGQTLLHNAAVWSLGIFVNPLTGAAFHNMRTIARSAVLVAMALEQATRLELSRLFARDLIDKAHKLLSRMLAISAVLTLIISACVFFLGPWVFDVMTHGRLEFDTITYTWLCGAALLFSMGFLYLSVAFALNLHVRLSIRYFVLALIITPFIIGAAHYGTVVVAMVVAVSDAIFLFISRQNAIEVLSFKRRILHVA